MVIEKYWGNYIGGTDDSLTLLDYLVGKQKDEIPLRELELPKHGSSARI